MLSNKGKIRLALLIVASISLGISFVSLSYMSSMRKRIEEIAHKDARLAELGKDISLKMLDARREEKNFIIYLDSTYIEKNRKIMAEVKPKIKDARVIAPGYSPELDSINFLVARYDDDIESLIEIFQEDPRALSLLQRQIINYEEKLKGMTQKRKLKEDSLPPWTSDLNIAMLSAVTRLSTEKARLITDLRETSDMILKLTEGITTRARDSLTKHSEEGIRFGVKAQRNALTIFLITGIFLIYLIFYLPNRIFLPFRRIVRVLKAIGRGETEFPLPNVKEKDELGELSRSFQEAIYKLKLFNDLKTNKIVEIEKKLHHILEEMGEAVLILSSDLKISYLNDAARKLFSIKGEVVDKHLKGFPTVWEIFGKQLGEVEKRERFEDSIRIKKLELRKRKISIIPNIGKNGKLESILIIVK